ncbi:Muskelin N-terminus-domain-containing protein [Dimargaris cristalligena]|uniref:Muskelin N-terminus-domain-containing protein n=1 Tax=Dimargaris cristalligena TaxID=215637 RepID=A0A4P9ZYE7_9FUNG|nr:Muskelin N-terminus-domain-containing protein [Dimargaris cristalligena]|eukprot:RKP38744.1 Muskelin N-terminus-domain-containing protein [Dimargaris cristalligena]
MEKLGYEVIDYSSYNADFYPDNIKVNQPTAGRSRWSSGAGDQHQFLTLKLDRPCLLQSITFGKFSRKHICNLKEFKVLAAATENHWVEILLSGLRDDSEPESFTVRNTLHGGRVPFPIQWLKVVPLMAYELKFNFSIWYLELRGVQDPAVVQPLVAQYQHYCERVALRMCLKVIRDLNPQRFDLQGMIRPLPADQPPIQLENPLVTDMRAAALGGHFDRLESMLTTCNANGLLNDYIRSCPYSAQWERVLPRSGPSPGGRGAHQMCMDPVGGHLYLFGGWSGTQSLSDFWRYHLESCQWELISADTAQQGGPGPRNYHTMCCCPQTQVLYLLGRYVDPDQRGENSLDSDFYAYHIHTNSWERLSVNTELDGGPRLSFDLEMTVDAATQQLFVFGGRTINSDARECVYSGLYRYSIPNKTWTVLRPDVLPTDVDAALRTRMEQSTLLDPRSRQLLIIATQRENTGQGDFTVYDMDTDTVFEKVTPHTNNSIVYDRRYTHRATYDPDRQEIIVFTGWAYNPSLKGQGTESSDIVSTLWSYHVPSETWTPIFRTHSPSPTFPCARIAHQLVYDERHRTHYLFGGNAPFIHPFCSSSAASWTRRHSLHPNHRLNDLWALQLRKPTATDVIKRMKFLVRRQHFLEMCILAPQARPMHSGMDSAHSTSVSSYVTAYHSSLNPPPSTYDYQRILKAIQYLQNQLAELVDFDNPLQVAAFHRLPVALLHDWPKDAPTREQLIHGSRRVLFDDLLAFFPDTVKEPAGSLVDMVVPWMEAEAGMA